MISASNTTRPRRRPPGAAREIQVARTAGKPREVDLAALPAVLAGDMWELGQHRLLCGDSTSRDAVLKLMDGDVADLMVTDPPYGVRYSGKSLVRRAIKNDDLAGERFVRFLAAAFCAAPLKPGGCFYVCSPSSRALESFFAAAAESGLEVRQTLVWVKNHFVLGRSDYHHRHELLLYGWKLGAPHYYSGGRKQHTVWEFDKPQRSPLHPTTKPLALLQRCIENNSRDGEIVYDGFSGSGSTLIACEYTGRRCRAVEIEPRYVATTIARWELSTGQRATLVRRASAPISHEAGNRQAIDGSPTAIS